MIRRTYHHPAGPGPHRQRCLACSAEISTLGDCGGWEEGPCADVARALDLARSGTLDRSARRLLQAHAAVWPRAPHAPFTSPHN